MSGKPILSLDDVWIGKEERRVNDARGEVRCVLGVEARLLSLFLPSHIHCMLRSSALYSTARLALSRRCSSPPAERSTEERGRDAGAGAAATATSSRSALSHANSSSAAEQGDGRRQAALNAVAPQLSARLTVCRALKASSLFRAAAAHG